jgi:hypothetical protein
LFDGVDQESQGILGLTSRPLEKLQFLMFEHFHARIPCIACGTLGQSTRDQWKDTATLVEAGIPVIYIDIRPRGLLNYDQSLETLWENVKAANLASMSAMLGLGRPDVLDTCRLSYFHSVFTRKAGRPGARERLRLEGMSIFEAIRALKAADSEDRSESTSQVL